MCTQKNRKNRAKPSRLLHRIVENVLCSYFIKSFTQIKLSIAPAFQIKYEVPEGCICIVEKAKVDK